MPPSDLDHARMVQMFDRESSFAFVAVEGPGETDARIVEPLE